MKMIAGLGNPGNEYAKTKHNAGFLFVDALAGHLGASGWKQKENALVAEARIGAEKVLLVKPQTYMNESGRAIGPLMDWYKLEPEDLIVVHDDMDIPAGVVRIRKKGSAGGHNGIKNIIAMTGTSGFKRIKVGVGEKPEGWDLADHVLGRFSSEHRVKVEEAIGHAMDAAVLMMQDETDRAMNLYN